VVQAPENLVHLTGAQKVQHLIIVLSWHHLADGSWLSITNLVWTAKLKQHNIFSECGDMELEVDTQTYSDRSGVNYFQ